MGTGGPFPGANAAEACADHSPPSSAMGQERVGAIPPLPPQSPPRCVAEQLYLLSKSTFHIAESGGQSHHETESNGLIIGSPV
jgi:hypothetical protein